MKEQDCPRGLAAICAVVVYDRSCTLVGEDDLYCAYAVVEKRTLRFRRPKAAMIHSGKSYWPRDYC